MVPTPPPRRHLRLRWIRTTSRMSPAVTAAMIACRADANRSEARAIGRAGECGVVEEKRVQLRFDAGELFSEPHNVVRIITGWPL